MKLAAAAIHSHASATVNARKKSPLSRLIAKVERTDLSAGGGFRNHLISKIASTSTAAFVGSWAKPNALRA